MPRSTLQAAALAVIAFTSTAQAAEPAWVAESNANARPMLELIAKYAPESAASLGVDGYDAAIRDLKPNLDQRFEADSRAVAGQLAAKLATATDPRVKQDLQILIDAERDQRTSNELTRKLMLPYVDVANMLFGSFQALLDPRVDRARYPAALERLKKYTGREPGYEPITKLAQDRSAERFGEQGLTGPWTVEVEQNLGNSQRYLEGIRGLFVKSGLKGYEKDLKLLERQVADYDAWVRKEILPRARTTNRLPAEIYADNLKSVGVKMEPKALIDRAIVGFVQTRDEMQSLARIIAKERGYASSDYKSVLRELKQQSIPNDQLLPTYNARLATIEDIVRRERLISLPDRKAVIRLATEAESAAQPAPHLSPPRLIGNTGEPAEFILPLENPNAAPGSSMDDFKFDAITWTLTAHEARPGHELQFAKMTEAGVSIPRAVFAFNSANVEGWALYAESFLKPYLPLEGQMGSLQMRLMRAARAFLDPMVNLGQITPDAAKKFLMDEVLLSEPMAKQEADRYSFLAPGQATSYFYGYEKQLAIRARAELQLREKFDVQSYHDFVI
ncbi:MAG: DUF885 domain-containing protein, partial [Gammaproteobacteria bacterium]|nr:DUF885 domain-containing protein [Gammaproteobacteria bacterium]